MHGKLPCPTPGHGVKHWSVLVVEAADVGLHAHLAVRVRQQALDGDEHLGDGEAWNECTAPVTTGNRKTAP